MIIDSQSDDGAPPADKPDMRKQAADEKPTKPPPTSLVEFVKRDDASAADYLKLAARKVPTVSEIAEALAADVMNLTALEKALDIVRECRRLDRRPIAILKWCESVLRRQAPQLEEWAADPDQLALQALEELVRWGQVAREEKDARKSVDTAVTLGINLLLLHRRLDALDALRGMWPLMKGEILGDRSSDVLHRRLATLIARAAPKGLRDLVTFAGVVGEQLDEAERATFAANRAAVELARERDDLKAAVSRHVLQIEQLEAKMQDALRREADLIARLDEAKTETAYSENTFKARTRRVLGERIDGLLSDAGEALGIEPPEVEVARERIEIVRNEIKKEIQWLSTSGD
jgi:hypothetical protein